MAMGCMEKTKGSREAGFKRSDLFDQLFADLTKAAFAVLKVQNSLVEVFFTEIRPKNGGEEEFGISELP